MSLPNPLSLLAGGAGGLISAIGGVIDKLSTTDEEKLAAKAEILKIQSDLTVKLAEVDAKFAEAQAKVLVAEAQSESWMTRNWRPILMLSFTYILVHTYVLAPIFGLVALEIPEDLWVLLKIGVGGYIVSRGVENVASYAPDVAANLRRP